MSQQTGGRDNNEEFFFGDEAFSASENKQNLEIANDEAVDLYSEQDDFENKKENKKGFASSILNGWML